MVGLLGPRQVGKTTLALEVADAIGGAVTRFDLERPSDLARLEEPELALEPLRGLVIIDEVQRRPDLFPVLRVLADRRRAPARFLVLGSASPELLRQESETLAGRIAFHELGGFALSEVAPRQQDRLWVRGGFPRSFTASSDADSLAWRQDFVRTFVERDLAPLGVTVPAPTLQRFWAMLAHVHGQVLNWSELGRSMGVSDLTVKRYTDHLAGALVVGLLRPWHENISKRQVKAPKVYLRDSGLLHALLDIGTQQALSVHPSLGASWEGFVLGQVLALLGRTHREAYFWATHQGAELDLLLFDGTKRFGFEFKRTAAPAVTASMRSALATLGLERLDVVHAGDETYPLAPRIRAVAFKRLREDLTGLAR
ncbi:MAG: ATP-binding protein [Myxococcaceae bacterium]|nr:ATP-binding protein [Myxococcaceae bacterium]